MFLGYCFFHFCNGLEEGTREPRTVPAIFAFLYRLGGKWFSAGVIMLIGGFAVWVGVRMLFRDRVPEGERENERSGHSDPLE